MQTDVQQYALADIAVREIGSCLFRCKCRSYNYTLMYESMPIII